MFGHNDNRRQDDNPALPPQPVPDALLSDEDENTSVTSAPVGAPAVNSDDTNQAEPASAQMPDPVTVTPKDDSTDSATSANEGNDSAVNAEPSERPSVSPGADSDLIGLKQQALQSLSPLVGHLDQTPEEKFRTTMMMIQASDDQSLIKTAYDAAQQISDDKVKAQALLDIVNEINYFTQQTDTDKEK